MGSLPAAWNRCSPYFLFSQSPSACQFPLCQYVSKDRHCIQGPFERFFHPAIPFLNFVYHLLCTASSTHLQRPSAAYFILSLAFINLTQSAHLRPHLTILCSRPDRTASVQSTNCIQSHPSYLSINPPSIYNLLTPTCSLSCIALTDLVDTFHNAFASQLFLANQRRRV